MSAPLGCTTLLRHRACGEESLASMSKQRPTTAAVPSRKASALVLAAILAAAFGLPAGAALGEQSVQAGLRVVGSEHVPGHRVLLSHGWFGTWSAQWCHPVVRLGKSRAAGPEGRNNDWTVAQ